MKDIEKRLRRAEAAVPAPGTENGSRVLDTRIVQWIGCGSDERDPFSFLLQLLDDEAVEVLGEELRLSIQRGFNDRNRHEDAHYLAALRAACDKINERIATHAIA